MRCVAGRSSNICGLSLVVSVVILSAPVLSFIACWCLVTVHQVHQVHQTARNYCVCLYPFLHTFFFPDI